ncbi:MAG: hypothetical protein H6590_06015 [Flavobacteriales bacterium]|nr:hypothetical protein [Flavobacteriales bacterium]
MPHALIRQANGQWRFTPLNGVSYLVSQGGATVEKELPVWLLRKVGDDDTNPLPDFVGGGIRAMCFHEGRLGLLSETSLTLSETNEPFNLFRTSVLDVVASDRIRVKAPTRHAETLHHCVPLGGDIVLFTGTSQYLLRSEGPFAPNSVSLVAAGGHDADPTATPIQVRDALMVPRSVGGYGAVSALQVAGDQRPKLVSSDVTAAVPGYLDVPYKLITTSQLDLVAAYGDPGDALYVYAQFFDENNARVHQSWQRWTFPAADSILHAWFRETDLFVVARVGLEVHLWRLRCQPESRDSGIQITYLDQRVDSRDLLAPVVSGGNTTYTLPYEPTEVVEVRVQNTLKAVRTVEVSGDRVTVQGDTSNLNLWFGSVFETRHDLSRLTMVDRRQVPDATGILRLDRGHVTYDKSGAFDVVIMDNFGNEDAHHFSGPYLGQGANYQNVRLTSGVLTFPIRARSEDCRISFRTSSTEALRLVSLDVDIRKNRVGRQRIQ